MGNGERYENSMYEKGVRGRVFNKDEYCSSSLALYAIEMVHSPLVLGSVYEILDMLDDYT